MQHTEQKSGPVVHVTLRPARSRPSQDQDRYSQTRLFLFLVFVPVEKGHNDFVHLTVLPSETNFEKYCIYVHYRTKVSLLRFGIRYFTSSNQVKKEDFLR